MHRVREGSISYRGKSQHTDSVGLRWSQALDGGDHTILNIMDPPVAHWLRRVHRVVNSIAFYLAVGFFRLLPPDSYCAGWDDLSLDVPRRAGWCLLPSPSVHLVAGWALADGVERRDTDLILSVGVEATDTVARCRDAVHCLELAVGWFCPVLDDVIGYGVWVARVPGDGDARGRCLCDDGGAGSSG